MRIDIEGLPLTHLHDIRKDIKSILARGASVQFSIEELHEMNDNVLLAIVSKLNAAPSIR